MALTGLLPVALPAAPRAVALAEQWPALTLHRLPGDFTRPVHITHAGDGSGRLFVVEKAGRIRILHNDQVLDPPFLDITGRVNSQCGECGLLSVAFPPDFAESHSFYVYYTAQGNPAPPSQNDDGDNDTVIARFRLSADPNRADPASETRILLQHQPYGNHNGGLLLFGPDEFLYVGLGDGGSGGDPDGNGQKTDTLLGKLLRIDVTGVNTYTVPSDNPFVSNNAYRPEIWALGLRNPWRFSFDRLTGDLYIGDVGQNNYEEIDYQPAGDPGGQNYGWKIMEGDHCFPGDPCDRSGLVRPIAEYGHDDFERNPDCSVTGGVVYHSPVPEQLPVYLYGDYCSGRIRALQRDGSTWLRQEPLLDTALAIVSFGEGPAGEVYVVDDHGRVYRLVEEIPNRLRLPLLHATRTTGR
jgi:glucose/arabinose dehydrogenase